MLNVIMNADISPWTSGDTSPSWQVTLLDKNNKPFDLVGNNVTTAQLSLSIYNSAFTKIGTGAGTWALVPAIPGTIQYNPVAGDSATPATYYLKFVVRIGGTSPQSTDFVQWVVQP